MSSVSIFQMEVQVPEEARALVIGKGGRTIKRFQQSPGILTARLLPSGKFQIRGDSREAVQSISSSIKHLVSRAVISKSTGYFPQFYRTCFCISVDDSLRAVHKVSFEKFNGEISYVPLPDRDLLCLCFMGEEEKNAAASSADNLAASLSDMASFAETTDFLPHWNFSGYKSDILPCFEFLRSEEQDAMRTIKMIVRFGKELLHGRSSDELLDQGFVPLSYLQNLFSQKLIARGFSTACSDTGVENLRLYLEREEYVKVSQKKKISIHVADREEKPARRFNISVRCVGNEGFAHNSEVRRILSSDDYFEMLGVDTEATADEICRAYRQCLLRIQFQAVDLAAAEKAKKSAKEASDCLLEPVQRERYLKIFYPETKFNSSDANPSSDVPALEEKLEISRVRREPRRHGFVTFCRGGREATDFRLAVMSHAREMDIENDMVEWVEEGWRNRTPDGLLVFDSASRYEITNIRYKEAETYVSEDFKFRIASIREMEGESERKKRWDFSLSSRWSKWNDGIAADMDSIVKNDVITLVKEAFKFSQSITVT